MSRDEPRPTIEPVNESTTEPQYHRETCYFCHEPDTHILQEHHIVPQRFGGTDTKRNLVRLCPNCHDRLERLYDGRFYERLATQTEKQETETDTQENREYKKRKAVKETVKNLENSEYKAGCVPIAAIDAKTSYQISKSDIEDILEQLRKMGDAYRTGDDLHGVV